MAKYSGKYVIIKNIINEILGVVQVLTVGNTGGGNKTISQYKTIYPSKDTAVKRQIRHEINQSIFHQKTFLSKENLIVFLFKGRK